jgi:NADPH-dependent ferric siderophore reductase
MLASSSLSSREIIWGAHDSSPFFTRLRAPSGQIGGVSSAKALLGAIAGRFIFRHGRVSAVTRLSEHFIRFDVEGPQLAGVRFVPGDKVQLFIADEGLRTYTPVEWSSDGKTFFLGYVHGDATPGAKWVRGVKVGDEAALFGPRRSIDATDLPGPLVFIGDETSVACALALARAKPSRHMTVLLEATHPHEVREVTRALALPNVTVTARGQLEAPLLAQFDVGATPIFTGRAATIQALKQALKAQQRNVSGLTKAYWAEGKRGLD